MHQHPFNLPSYGSLSFQLLVKKVLLHSLSSVFHSSNCTSEQKKRIAFCRDTLLFKIDLVLRLNAQKKWNTNRLFDKSVYKWVKSEIKKQISYVFMLKVYEV